MRMIPAFSLFALFASVTPIIAFIQHSEEGFRRIHENTFALKVGPNERVDIMLSSTRRETLIGLGTVSGFATLFTPQAASAGEVGARITRAVTQSDLGVSVRRSVVKGAQVIDSLDGKWEQFSG